MEPDQAADVIGALEPEERTAVLSALELAPSFEPAQDLLLEIHDARTRS